MATKDQMEKYLNKGSNYVETLDKVFKRSLDKADKEQKGNKKKVEKMLIRDEDRGTGIRMVESEDGVMTYFTGAGNYHQAIRYGKKIGLSRRSRLHNIMFAKEVLTAEGIMDEELEAKIAEYMEQVA